MKVLVIGKTPPPIGGVTIYVKRLLYSLKANNINVEVVDFNFISIISGIIRSDIVHLNCSNPYLRFIVSIICKLLNTKLIITYHGNLGRFGTIKNFFDSYSIRLSNVPVLLNQVSLSKALKENDKSIMISTKLPFTPEEQFLEDNINNTINSFISQHSHSFCTNAYKFSIDNNGNEIYGISGLVRLFESLPEKCLVVSDPSGTYTNFFQSKSISLPSNVLLISQPHNFIPILRLTNGLIRSTTTDGNSLTIHEAITLEKVVIASDCVDRPEECITFRTGDLEHLKSVLIDFEHIKYNLKPNLSNTESIDDIICTYNRLANQNEANHTRSQRR